MQPRARYGARSSFLPKRNQYHWAGRYGYGNNVVHRNKGCSGGRNGEGEGWYARRRRRAGALAGSVKPRVGRNAAYQTKRVHMAVVLRAKNWLSRARGSGEQNRHSVRFVVPNHSVPIGEAPAGKPAERGAQNQGERAGIQVRTAGAAGAQKNGEKPISNGAAGALQVCIRK